MPSLPDEFEIHRSDEGAIRSPTIPPDLATCEACLEEIQAPHQQRHGYPFTNCTNCGPRWSIITGLPYDRPAHVDGSFRDVCGLPGGIRGSSDRRFHAQPIACPDCGPSLQTGRLPGTKQATGEAALQAAAEAVAAGAIVALKGLGGFQLIADATSDAPCSDCGSANGGPTNRWP